MISITATNLDRFMKCNGSLTMPHFKSDLPHDTETREEGIAVHWLIQQVCSGKSFAEDLVERKSPNNVFITGDMVDHIQDYLEGEGAGGFIEHNTDFSGVGWHISGRADRITAKGDVLHVDDFKYGWSIAEPKHNWTLISYALGYIAQNPKTQIKTVKFTIYQPRPRHPEGSVRSWQIDYDTLKDYYWQIDEALRNPRQELNTGNHCHRCPAFVNCPAANKALMNAIDVSEVQFSDEISNEDLSTILNLTKRATELFKSSWSAYSELALHRLKKGEMIKGYSVENELSNRQWNDHVTPEMLKAITGVQVTKEVLLSPNQVEKSGVDKNIVSSLTTRNTKGFKLVQIDENSKAKKLFNN